MRKTAKYLMTVIFLSGLIVISAFAGELNAPAAQTDPASAMFTLEDLYNRLLSGAAGNKRGGAFTEPTTGPGSTMHNLNEIMNKAPAVDAQGADNAQVLSGKNFWGLTAGQWGIQSGTMSNVGAQNLTPGAASQTITAGYHDGTGKVGGDPGLVSGNIKAGTTIFGVAGKAEVVDTSTGNATAGEVLLGRKAWANGAEVTGTLATRGISNATTTIEAGYYTNTSLEIIDTDLTFTNIKAGTTIFGVTGKTEVVDTSTGNATGGDILLGRQAWSNGVLATGTRVGGVTLTGGFLWVSQPRWYKPGNGTIIDCKTGLVWLSSPIHVARPYLATDGAQIDCMRYLYSICSGYAGLTDGSLPGDWDMPTLIELKSLHIDSPPGQGIGTFTGPQAFDNPWLNEYYWTSTPVADSYGVASTDKIYVINMCFGSYIAENKLATETQHYLWPIRRGFRW